MDPAWTVVENVDALTGLLGAPSAAARDKVRTRLDPLDRAWLAASPFCLVATSDLAGNCDVSPKGDPAGFVHVLDDTTIVVPERPGNKRADGFRNILANPHVGLLFLIPGRGDTLRINGRATLVSDAPFFEELVVEGHRPVLAVVVEIDQIFHHCQKAFLRSSLWDAASWTPDRVPSRAVIAQRLERPTETVEALEAYYGPSYRDGLYRG